MSLQQFLHMGGYGLYVWPSYLLAAIVVQLNVVSARRSLREAQRAARRRFDSAAGGPAS